MVYIAGFCYPTFFFVLQIGNNFTSLYMEIVRRFSVSDLSLTTTFSDSPDAALREIRNRDIRIVFGFFSETKAHDVLCKVRHNSSLVLRI